MELNSSVQSTFILISSWEHFCRLVANSCFKNNAIPFGTKVISIKLKHTKILFETGWTRKLPRNMYNKLKRSWAQTANRPWHCTETENISSLCSHCKHFQPNSNILKDYKVSYSLWTWAMYWLRVMDVYIHIHLSWALIRQIVPTL